MTMTMQEIFDKVSAHLLKQGQKAQGVDPSCDCGSKLCRYRTPDGLSCALGCLIPPECYDPAIEGSIISQPGEYLIGVLEKSGVITHEEYAADDTKVSLLGSLQDIHDASAPEYWANDLEGVKKSFGLK